MIQKNISNFELQTVGAIYHNQFFTLTETAPNSKLEMDNKWETTVKTEESNPEEKLLKTERYKLLSQEAKEVILTILNAPQEIAEIFGSPVTNLFNCKRIEKYFLTIWPRRKTKIVFKELKQFVASF